MKAAVLGLLIGMWLTGCAINPVALAPARDQVRHFAIEARFALRVTPSNGPVQSSGGRLAWTHENGRERILIANPIGIGLAEIDSTPGHSRLKTADGKQYESPDADTLLEETTGQRLPVARLPAWLLGRAGPDGRLERDAAGRPLHLDEAGWGIDYLYDDEAPDSLPSRLNLRLGNDIDLRLRIEEWKHQP